MVLLPLYFSGGGAASSYCCIAIADRLLLRQGDAGSRAFLPAAEDLPLI